MPSQRRKGFPGLLHLRVNAANDLLAMFLGEVLAHPRVDQAPLLLAHQHLVLATACAAVLAFEDGILFDDELRPSLERGVHLRKRPCGTNHALVECVQINGFCLTPVCHSLASGRVDA